MNANGCLLKTFTKQNCLISVQVFLILINIQDRRLIKSCKCRLGAKYTHLCVETLTHRKSSLSIYNAKKDSRDLVGCFFIPSPVQEQF